MVLQATEPRRLYRQIAERMRDLIVAGVFPRGARLPSERDIAVDLDVSRTTVREALIALEINGLIEVRGGSGIYVSTSAGLAHPLFAESDAGPGPFELLHARWLVEGEVAALAAASIDARGLKFLEGTIAAIEAAGDEDFRARDGADRAFHLRIVEATENSALIQTVRMYWDQRRGPMWKRAAQHFDNPTLLAEVVADHRAIFSALRARNPAAAKRAMRAHIQRVQKEFATGKLDAGEDENGKDKKIPNRERRQTPPAHSLTTGR